MQDPNWTLEWLKIAQGLLGTLVGGALVLLGGWLADRRKEKNEFYQRSRREKALLTGMFAVRNYVLNRINEWAEDQNTSRLEPLRTAQAYVHRLIDKAPGESESLMIAIIEIGLTLDALLETLSRPRNDLNVEDQLQMISVVSRQVHDVVASLEQFDLISSSELTIFSDDDMQEFAGFEKQEPEQ